MSQSLLVLFHAPAAHRAIPWAAHLARKSGHALDVLCVTRENRPRLDQVLEDAEGASDLVQAARAACTELGDRPPHVFDCRGPNLRRAVLDAARELGARQLLLDADLDVEEEGSQSATVLKLARVAPFDVLVLDVGELAPPPARAIVAQLGGGGSFAMRKAARAFVGPECPLVALADGDAGPRSQRVFERVRDKLPDELRAHLSQDHVDGKLIEGFKDCVQPGDLVLVEAEEPGRLPALMTWLRKLHAERGEIPCAVAVARSEQVAGPGRIERALEKLRYYLPSLDRDRRRELAENLEHNGTLSADFIVMLMLSAAIASMGLVQSSAGVVIGAMLVAPLMTPIVAMGLALVQANRQLFRSSLIATVAGIAGALLAASAVGLLTPWDDLSSELVARGAPNLFDLAIALLSGVAAAFALARPGLAGTLVGVAIAVALVPPLATVGICLVRGALEVAAGAALLFTTNLLAIIIGATVVFQGFGLGASRRGQVIPAWVRVALGLVVLGLMPISLELGSNLSRQRRSGVQRSWGRPLPAALRAAIEQRVGEVEGVELVLMARSGVEDGFGVEIVLASSTGTHDDLEEDIAGLVQEQGEAGLEAHIVTLQVAATGTD